MPPAMRKGPETIDSFGQSIEERKRDPAYNEPRGDRPVDVGKHSVVPEQPGAAHDDQSDGQTGVSPEASPSTAISKLPRRGNVDEDAVGIVELELSVLALGEELEPDLSFASIELR